MILVMMLLLVLTIIRGTGGDLYIILLFEGRGWGGGGGGSLFLLWTKGWRKNRWQCRGIHSHCAAMEISSLLWLHLHMYVYHQLIHVAGEIFLFQNLYLSCYITRHCWMMRTVVVVRWTTPQPSSRVWVVRRSVGRKPARDLTTRSTGGYSSAKVAFFSFRLPKAYNLQSVPLTILSFL